jgi:hypothetical protein
LRARGAVVVCARPRGATASPRDLSRAVRLDAPRPVTHPGDDMAAAKKTAKKAAKKTAKKAGKKK